MNKKEKSERSLYVKPECNLLITNVESILHNASGNAGSITPGEGAGDAKQSLFWEDEEVVSVSNNWSE